MERDDGDEEVAFFSNKLVIGIYYFISGNLLPRCIYAVVNSYQLQKFLTWRAT